MVLNSKEQKSDLFLYELEFFQGFQNFGKIQNVGWNKLGKKFHVTRIAGWSGGPIALLVMVASLPKPDAARINTIRLLTSEPAKIWRGRKQYH